jgi:endonuclease/exonuclease/phosphatase family metal-dependent hydrolase
MAGTLRVVTYNVRRFKASDGSSSVDKIAKALSALQPSVVALNEVDAKLRPDAVASLAEQLGGFHYHFFGHVKGQYGNALLSRFPITATRETHLRGGTEVGFPAGTKKLNGEIAKAGELHRLARGMLECDIKVPHAHWHGGGGGGDGDIEPVDSTIVTFAVTHLDHITELQREVQIEHVLETLAPRRNHTILLGDLNALWRPDYSGDEWRAIEAHNAKSVFLLKFAISPVVSTGFKI